MFFGYYGKAGPYLCKTFIYHSPIKVTVQVILGVGNICNVKTNLCMTFPSKKHTLFGTRVFVKFLSLLSLSLPMVVEAKDDSRSSEILTI